MEEKSGTTGWQSGGMMGETAINAEMESTRAALDAELAKWKAREDAGEVFTMGEGCTMQEIWGYGPYGFQTQLERIKFNVGDGDIGEKSARRYWDLLIAHGHTEDEIDREIPILRRALLSSRDCRHSRRERPYTD